MHSLLFILLPPVVPIHTPPNPTAPTTHPHPLGGGCGVVGAGVGWGGWWGPTTGKGGRKNRKASKRIENPHSAITTLPCSFDARKTPPRSIARHSENESQHSNAETNKHNIAHTGPQVTGGALLNSNMTTTDHNNINHPEHYNRHPSGVECIDIAEGFNFNLGNAIKYIWRAGLKEDAVEDLHKAAHYIAREIGRLQRETLGWGLADDEVQLVRIDGEEAAK